MAKKKTEKSKKTIPFLFWNKDCPNCGAIKSIKFLDYYDNIVPNISKADGAYKAFCNKCNKEYAIIWEIKDDVYLPSLADKNDTIAGFEEYFADNEKRNIDDVLFGIFKGE